MRITGQPRLSRDSDSVIRQLDSDLENHVTYAPDALSDTHDGVALVTPERATAGGIRFMVALLSSIRHVERARDVAGPILDSGSVTHYQVKPTLMPSFCQEMRLKMVWTALGFVAGIQPLKVYCKRWSL